MAAETKSKTVTAKITPSLKKKVEAEAKKKDRNVSYIIVQALTNYFARS